MAKKKELINEIIFTGFSNRKDFKLSSTFRCYICKRYDGKQSVQMKIVKSKYEIVVDKLRVQPFIKKEKYHELTFPICSECYILLSNFSKFIPFSKEHPLPKKARK